MIRYISLTKRSLNQGQSGSFLKMLSINEALFVVILVGKISQSTTNPRNLFYCFMTMVIYRISIPVANVGKIQDYFPWQFFPVPLGLNQAEIH